MRFAVYAGAILLPLLLSVFAALPAGAQSPPPPRPVFETDSAIPTPTDSIPAPQADEPELPRALRPPSPRPDFGAAPVAPASTGPLPSPPAGEVELPRALRPPPPRPLQRLAPTAAEVVHSWELPGQTGAILFDLDDGSVLDSVAPDTALPPASAIKIVAAVRALQVLGPQHRFETRLVATGPVNASGVLEGDLYLVGGGDPTLDTADLDRMTGELRTQGIAAISGRFFYDDLALPRGTRIDPLQRDHVVANTGFSGLNLNFNRVRVEAGPDFRDQWRARLLAFADERSVVVDSIAVNTLPNDGVPSLEHRIEDGREIWYGDGMVFELQPHLWLPVRDPGAYAASAFRQLAREAGLALPRGVRRRVPADGTTLASHQSMPLARIVAEMLYFSNNLTAEVLGLAAAQADGAGGSLAQLSAGHVRALVGDGAKVTARPMDHSGLSIESRVTARDLREILLAANADDALVGDVRHVLPVFERGEAIREAARDRVVLIQAKTGTLHFVSALAGYVHIANCRRDLGFAILSADLEQRGLLKDQLDPPIRVLGPRATRAWRTGARQLERALLANWIRRFGCR